MTAPVGGMADRMVPPRMTLAEMGAVEVCLEFPRPADRRTLRKVGVAVKMDRDTGDYFLTLSVRRWTVISADLGRVNESLAERVATLTARAVAQADYRPVGQDDPAPGAPTLRGWSRTVAAGRPWRHADSDPRLPGAKV